MGIAVTLYYGMKKDVNSTKLPTPGMYLRSVDLSCSLFEPCSMISPVIVIDKPAITGADLEFANYASIPEFARYYYINDIEWRDGHWRLYLSVDVLASWKPQIGDTSQYILRSESTWNQNIKDTLYTPVGGKTIQGKSVSVNPFTSSLSGGMYVLAVTNQSPTIGSNQYIAMTASQMQVFLNKMMSNTTYMGLSGSDLDDATTKVILNPIQYVQSVKWFPFSVSSLVQATDIYFGWWKLENVNHKDFALSQLIQTISFSIDIPKHGQAASRGAYLNLDPYTQYTLLLPVVGEINIPAELIATKEKLFVTLTIDLVTGSAEIDINATLANGLEPSHVLHSTCNIGVEIPIAQITTDTVSAAKSAAGGILGAVGGFASGNYVGGISSLVTGAIDTAVSALTPIPSFMGTAGNLGAYTVVPTLYAICQPISSTAAPMFGRPLCEIRKISTLSGFIMCGRSHLEIPGATRNELDMIESFLNGGFRYE